MSMALIIGFPLIGFFINGALQLSASRLKIKTSAKTSGVIATAAMIASFFVAAAEALNLKALPVESRMIEQLVFHWIRNFDFSLRFDTLSSVFTLVITGVGALIHLYSIGYMEKDETPARYFAYLNLFCVFMLILVLGTSLPLIFLGWEGVGLASYLLIGYWYQDFEKVKAGQKAFIMNRIGDLGFLIAMFVAFQYAGTLDVVALNSVKLDPIIATVFGLPIFFACTGKSAQIPLFTWLPDAMAGPTPVSALIHAATMVTSGIYLLTRMSGLISSSEVTLAVIATTGAVTAFVAATIACAQNDIKKILAYSTVSQLGFMFLACGVGAFDAAVFHVMTHAFFKALLFLGAGSVIHALHEEQDIFKMGALRKKLPITSITFMVGWAAIIGLPPLSGFFSKDEILYKTFISSHGSIALFIVGLASAFLTSFYMTRLLIVVFFGPSRVEESKKKKIHESPALMAIPLIVLAMLAFVGGWLGSPIHSAGTHEQSQMIEIAVMVGSVLLSLSGAGIAYWKYIDFKGVEKVNLFLASGWKIDSFYSCFFGGGTAALAKGLNRLIEEGVVQRAIRWSGAMVNLSGTVLRTLQVGSIQAYIMMMMFMMVFVLFLLSYGVGHYGKL